MPNNSAAAGKFGATLGVGTVSFLVLWALAGLAALAMSVYCISAYPSSESAVDWVGILLAIFMGPLYWVYYFLRTGYCGRK